MPKTSFIDCISIKEEIKESNQKISFLNESIDNGKRYIYVSLKHDKSFFDLSTVNDEYKYFFNIPYNLYIDEKWSHMKFRTKIETDKLLELLVLYDAEFPLLNEDSAKKFI